MAATTGAQSLEFAPKLLYDKIFAYCQNNPPDFIQAKLLYITALDNQIEHLLYQQSYTDIFDCFSDALTLFPEDSDVLNVLGVALNRLEKPLESLKYFDKAHTLCPKNLKILENRTNVINEWIPRWHFIMLNDTKRNDAFRRAITNRIHNNGCNVVLDIGTGTGLLALYSHEAGAKKIYACDSNEIMTEIAETVFNEDEKYKNIVLLKDHSTNLSAQDLDDDRVDLIVTETLDSGVFGEGILSTLIHAKENLLKTNGKIIPGKVEVFLFGADGLGVGKKQDSIQRTLRNSIYLENIVLTPKTDGPYDTYNHRDKPDFITRTSAALALTVDFNDLDSMRAAESGALDGEHQLVCLESGAIEGFFVYFSLFLEDSDSNVLNSFIPHYGNTTTSCWDPVVFRLSQPVNVQKDEILKVKISCKDGVLNLTHSLEPKDTDIVPIETQVFSFLADHDYLSELEQNLVSYLQNNKRKQRQLGDFSIFPHIGLKLLREKRVDSLYCLETTRDLIEEIIDVNEILIDSVNFVQDLDELVQNENKLDVIILQPITAHGTLNEEQLKYHENLTVTCLTPDGVIYPNRMEICAQLVHSLRLREITQVLDDSSLPSSLISKCMNQYSTQHHFDMKTIDKPEFCSPLSDEVVLSKIHFDEEYYEKDTGINLSLTGKEIDGILYSFRIYFSENQIPIVTNRSASFCTQNCFVQHVGVDDSRTCLKIRFVQHDYVIRCEILDGS